VWNIFLVRFRRRHCCVSVIMQPSDNHNFTWYSFLHCHKEKVDLPEEVVLLTFSEFSRSFSNKVEDHKNLPKTIMSNLNIPKHKQKGKNLEKRSLCSSLKQQCIMWPETSVMKNYLYLSKFQRYSRLNTMIQCRLIKATCLKFWKDTGASRMSE